LFDSFERVGSIRSADRDGTGAGNGVAPAGSVKTRAVDASPAIERVIAAMAEELVISSESRKRIVEVTAHKSLRCTRSGSVDAGIRQTPEDDVRRAGIQVGRARIGCADDKVGKTIAIY